MSTVKIWAVTEGPKSIDEVDYDDNFAEDHPEGCNYFTVCKVEKNGKLEDHEFWFPTLTNAHEFKNYIDSHMEAVELDDEGILDHQNYGNIN